MDCYKDIFKRCRQGDRRAQLKFYTIFYKGVYNCSFRIVGNAQEAEDVMQESFIKVFDKMGCYADCSEESMLKVLKRIAINGSIDLLRKRKFRFQSLNEETDFVDEQQVEVMDEQEVLDMEKVKQLMGELAEGYRLILNLHLIEGFDYESIAEQLQISASTARSQYARARLKLIGLLKEKHYEYCM